MERIKIKEIWKDIKEYEDSYQVSNKGRIKSNEKKWIAGNGVILKHPDIILKPLLDSDGYKCVMLYKNTNHKNYKIHRLVASSFILNVKNKKEVNHKDGNKLNNDVDNLEWCTHADNIKHAIEIGLIDARKKVIQYDHSMKKIRKYHSIKDAGKITGICRQNISKVCLKRKGFNTAGGYIWRYAQ